MGRSQHHGGIRTGAVAVYGTPETSGLVAASPRQDHDEQINLHTGRGDLRREERGHGRCWRCAEEAGDALGG